MAKYDLIGSIRSFPSAPDVIYSPHELVEKMEKKLKELEKRVKELEKFRESLENL